MPEFSSPLGNKKFSSVPLREFDVPDESYSMPEDRSILDFEEEVKEAREIKRTGKQRLNDPSRRKIEMLLGMIRQTRRFELDNNVYELQTLKSKDLREIYMEASKFDGTVQFPFELRKQTLARSIILIAGMEVEQFLHSNSLESRLSFVDELPESFLQRLFNEYQLLVKESDEKYAIKETEVKEVIEDLKK